ncbi:hypothetical protein [Alloactinosynnema sp. L-07]|uniref:hypothetical protein n=1 Tax=Alloactinosynnema sp. L-07 TaxID=1653480 RepID=UPI0012FABE23|nr:hypothetical protein [Alloactinosynnema sp. L-07]
MLSRGGLEAVRRLAGLGVRRALGMRAGVVISGLRGAVVVAPAPVDTMAVAVVQAAEVQAVVWIPGALLGVAGNLESLDLVVVGRQVESGRTVGGAHAVAPALVLVAQQAVGGVCRVAVGPQAEPGALVPTEAVGELAAGRPVGSGIPVLVVDVLVSMVVIRGPADGVSGKQGALAGEAVWARAGGMAPAGARVVGVG